MNVDFFKNLFDKLKHQSGIMAFGLIGCGCILLVINHDFKSIPGVMGTALVGIGASFIVILLALAIQYEDRAQSRRMYEPLINYWKKSAKESQNWGRSDLTQEDGDGIIGGKKKSYQARADGKETTAG